MYLAMKEKDTCTDDPQVSLCSGRRDEIALK